MCETELCKQCDLFSLTWSSTLRWFCNRSWLSQQEPDFIVKRKHAPSLRTSLKIYILLCNKSYRLLHMCVHNHTHTFEDHDGGLRCAVLCVCVSICIIIIFTQTLTVGPQLHLSLLTCQARDSERATQPFR